jgi:hypothetical protein
MKSRVFLTAAAAGFFCAHAMAASPAAPARSAAASADPWAKVPALPTACYSTQDQWDDQNNTAIDAVQEMFNAQQEKNTAIDGQLSRAMNENPMAMAQAMQQAMMNDPANAQKMIEKMTKTGQEAGTELPARQAKEQQLEDESKALQKQYDAALAKASGPALGRWHAFQKKLGWQVEPGFAMMPDPSWPQSARQELGAVQKERDAAYVANCAQWWSATGQFPVYMKRYKTYLVQERIPYFKNLIDQPRLDQYKLLNVPADGYRTTTDFQAAIDYMKMASRVFGYRDLYPLCRPGTYCQ